MAEAGHGDGEEEEDEDSNGAQRDRGKKGGFSSGERMLKVLKEIVDCTDDAIYLFDEWDAILTRPIGQRQISWSIDWLHAPA